MGGKRGVSGSPLIACQSIGAPRANTSIRHFGVMFPMNAERVNDEVIERRNEQIALPVRPT